MKRRKKRVSPKTSTPLTKTEPIKADVQVTEPVQPVAVETAKEYPHDKLLQALYFAFDLFSRPNIPFFLLDDTARSAKDNQPLKGSQITVGIRDLEYQERSMSIMSAFCLPIEKDETHMRFEFEGVPILVKIIQNGGAMFTSLDNVHYYYESFNVPNPFDVYWDNRDKY